MTERDVDITAPATLMIQRIFNAEKIRMNESDKKKNRTDNVSNEGDPNQYFNSSFMLFFISRFMVFGFVSFWYKNIFN